MWTESIPFSYDVYFDCAKRNDRFPDLICNATFNGLELDLVPLQQHVATDRHLALICYPHVITF